MKGKMVLVLSSIFLMACSGFASGTTHIEKAQSADLAGPQINESIELNAP